MPKKIDKKRLKKIKELAKDVVDDTDMDTLIDTLAKGIVGRDRLVGYAVNMVTKSLSALSKKEFDEAWDDYYQVDYVLEERGLSMDDIRKLKTIGIECRHI